MYVEFYLRFVLISSYLPLDEDIIHLPFSGVGDWSEDVKAGRLLDAAKPTICISKVGGRSINIANFLASVVGFEEVYSEKTPLIAQLDVFLGAYLNGWS